MTAPRLWALPIPDFWRQSAGRYCTGGICIRPYWYPRHNKLSQLVYAASSTDADTVFVAGKKVVEAGKLLTFDEEKIYAEAEACTRKLLNK